MNKKCVNLTKLTEKPLQLMLFQLHDYIQLKQFDILLDLKSPSCTLIYQKDAKSGKIQRQLSEVPCVGRVGSL